MSLSELLTNEGIRRVLIVDDVCDTVPTANDIDPTNEAWPTFNDDLQDEHRKIIVEAYPQAKDDHFDVLIADDGYVATVWNLRDKLGEISLSLIHI